MADDGREVQDPGRIPEETVIPVPNEAGSSEKVRKSRRLILGALAATGAFELTAWRAQAHGNRSSHFICFGAERFLDKRSSAPYTTLVGELDRVTEQSKKLAHDLEARSIDIEVSPAYQELESRKRDLQSQVIDPISNQVLKFIRQGDRAAAVATIEGVGVPSQVLGLYNQALLELGHLGDEDQGLTSTSAFISEVGFVAEQAARYCDKLMKRKPRLEALAGADTLKEEIAEVLHNVASFTLPDKGDVPAKYLEIARRAAEKELTLRRAIGEPLGVTRALSKLGYSHLRAGDRAKARQFLTECVERAVLLSDKETLAWGQYFLSQAVREADPAWAGRLWDEARDVARQALAEGNDYIAVLMKKLGD
jgi:hypothetical protein